MDSTYKEKDQSESFEDISIAKTMEETDKNCPQCGGVMDFDPATGKLKCPYCEYEEVIKIEKDEPKKAKEMDFNEAELTANCNWGVATKTVICESCGAESVYDALQTAAVCPFCGSNQVMETHDVNTIAPGGVVPFQVTDKQASERFKKWIKGKWFCPKLAKESAKPNKFQGVYLPYWTFDTQTTSTYTAEYGITRTTKDKDGDTHTHTDWYRTSGRYKAFFNDELVFASNKHDAGILAGIEPFDTENNKAYQPEYIAGFVAERYSLGLKSAWTEARNSIRGKVRNGIDDQIRSKHVQADCTRNIQMDIDYRDVTYKYLLLPVWMSSFKYKEKVYQFMVNGQTGKVAGKTPLSIPKILLTIAAIIAIIMLIYYFS